MTAFANGRPAMPIMAVFDIGKTNAKLLVFGADGALLHERRKQAAWRIVDGLTVLDDNSLFSWITAKLGEAASAFAVRNVMVATQGCTFALLARRRLAAPILDDDEGVPATVAHDFKRLRDLRRLNDPHCAFAALERGRDRVRRRARARSADPPPRRSTSRTPACATRPHLRGNCKRGRRPRARSAWT